MAVLDREGGCARSGAGEDQHRSVKCFHRLALLRVEVAEIRRGPGAKRARCNTPCNWLRAQRSGVVALWFGHVVGKGRQTAG